MDTKQIVKVMAVVLLVLLVASAYWYSNIYTKTPTSSTPVTTNNATTPTNTSTPTPTLVSGQTYIIKELLYNGTLYDRDSNRYQNSTAPGGANNNNFLASSTATTSDVKGGLKYYNGTLIDPITGNFLGNDLKFHTTGSSNVAAAISITSSGVLTLGGNTLYAVPWNLGDGTQCYFTTTAGGNHATFTCTFSAVT